jgi:hypothetical protein
MKSKGTSSNWGGKRKNQTGRPKGTKDWSAIIKQDVLKHVKRMAVQTGDTFGATLAKMCWDPEGKVQSAVRLGAAKLISEILVIRESHKTVEKVQGPVIGLPPVKKMEESVETAGHHPEEEHRVGVVH